MKYIIVILSIIFSGSVFATGWLDYATSNQYTGWACDTASADSQITVQAWRDDGIFLGSATAQNVREVAVASACGSNHSWHGFTMDLQNDSQLLDDAWHTVTLRSINIDGTQSMLGNSPVSVFFKSDPALIMPPNNAGGVVGRDLAVFMLAPAGHIGLWDGGKVIEMLQDGGGGVRINTFENFKSRSKPWQSINVKISPTHAIKTCYETSCDLGGGATSDTVSIQARFAIVRRAMQIYFIGADYTLGAPSKIAESRFTDRTSTWNIPAKRGLYRCDTFVLDAFAITLTRPYASVTYYPDRIIIGEPLGWSNKIYSIYIGAILPSIVYEKLKNI